MLDRREYSYFPVSPEMFDWVQVRALTGPLKDIQRPVPNPILRCVVCVLRVLVLLEGEPSTQSEVLSALEQVFINDLSLYFALFIFPLILTSLPVPENIPTARC